MEFIQRKVYFELQKHLDSSEISLILGPRQAGKTTLMLKLMEWLKKNNKPTAYFNLDNFEDQSFFKTQNTLLDRIEKLVGSKNGFVFIDEIQRMENAGLFLKGLYDTSRKYKYIVSGSGSLELKANVIEPMTGRKKIFYCLPLSFTEFAAYKLGVSFKKAKLGLSDNHFKTERIIKEYFSYGGYPAVVLVEKEKGKLELLKEIYKSYLEKDIQLLLGVEKGWAFETLVKILAGKTGQIVNRAELASTCGINEKTVEKYLFLLEKTFIISMVRPFFRNARKEMIKSPKIYFNDLGFLSLAKGRFGAPDIEGDVFENACFLRLKELELLESVKYWRSSAGAEVDFIISDAKTGTIVPVEAKVSARKEALGKSLISFISSYKSRFACIYALSGLEEKELTRFNCKIRFMPYFSLPVFNQGIK